MSRSVLHHARLGLEGKGDMVRIGAVHYNTVEEIRRLREALRTMA
jgi:selenocysteine lyase/cysteine desulfurase